jgi:hypothetical protein
MHENLAVKARRGLLSGLGLKAKPNDAQRSAVAQGSVAERGGKRFARLLSGFVLMAAPLVGAGSACLDRPIGSPDPVTTNIFVDRITQTTIDKIDLLFMIDNSISMSDKQAILRLAVPDVVNRLVNPVCIDQNGNQFAPPATSDGRCPTGQSREFNPINNINIAIVSSSLGDAGANEACVTGDTVDMAHLVGSLQRGRQPNVDPAKGFLEWRPGTNVNTLIQNFQDMVTATGEKGCGWEASLESWFRFLIDPFPYEALERVKCTPDAARNDCVRRRTGADGRIATDATILAQRAAFLRPDSLVAIIMLSDENDCSIEPLPQNWVVAAISGTTPMFRGTAACDRNPNDPCCTACVLQNQLPAGCPNPDPVCAATANNQLNRLPDGADGRNLRCYDQKRRFGYDFLYPTQRYVNALRERRFCWSDSSLTPVAADCKVNDQPQDLSNNPLYAGGRDPSSVFLAGIVGVPYQAIASTTDKNGNPLPANTLRFKTASELQTSDWDAIAGNPGSAETGAAPAPPLNPYMVETPAQTRGITRGNDINGRDYATNQGVSMGVDDDLQYACIFPLPPDPQGNQRNCANLSRMAGDACDCFADELDKPLCEQQPGVSAPGPIQYWAKAYPGLRHLQVLRDYGENSIVASICARNVTDAARPDFGYRPAIAAIIDRLKEKLGDRCLPRQLEPDPDTNLIPCSLVEVQRSPANGQCICDERIRRFDPDADTASVVRARLAADQDPLCGTTDPNCLNVCMCEVQQVEPGAELTACQNEANPSGIEGWCYVANTPEQPMYGNPALVANCPATERRLLRFVGAGLQPNTVTFVSCTGSTLAR